MSNKKELNFEELQKVNGGTYIHESGIELYTIDEIKKLTRFDTVRVFRYYKDIDCMEDYGKGYIRRIINDTTVEFTLGYMVSGRRFTVGDNQEYFVAPYTRYY